MHRLLAAVVVLTCSAQAGAVLTIEGRVAHPLQLSMADLAAMETVAVTVRQATAMHGAVIEDCKGPRLTAVIAKAGLALGGDRKTALAHSLLVTAQDGYVVAFSLPELDPDYGAAAPILATECDGRRLDLPKLVVPSDKHAGRAVHSVVTVEIR